MVEFTNDIRKFLDDPHFMVLATIKRDGTPQMSVVWYEFDGGLFKVSTVTNRAKFKNIERDPRVTLLITDKLNPYKYIHLTGKVTKTSKENAHDFIDLLSKKYLGQDKYPYDPERKDERVILFIEPETSLVFDPNAS